MNFHVYVRKEINAVVHEICISQPLRIYKFWILFTQRISDRL